VERSQRSPLAIQNQQLATPPLMTFLERGTAGRLDFLFRCRCIPLVPRHLRLSDTAHLAGAGCVGKRLCFMATSTLALQIEANHLSGTAITWLCAVVSTARSALLFPMSHATPALVRMAHGPAVRPDKRSPCQPLAFRQWHARRRPNPAER